MTLSRCVFDAIFYFIVALHVITFDQQISFEVRSSSLETHSFLSVSPGANFWFNKPPSAKLIYISTCDWINLCVCVCVSGSEN